MANLNGNKPWSEKELANLERALARRYPIELIAGYLMRDVEELRQKREEVRQKHEALLAGSTRLPTPGDLPAFRVAPRLRSRKNAA